MLTRADLHAACMGKPAVVETFPFGEDSVYKVGGKMFALLAASTATGQPYIVLKCDPALADMLRQTYPDVVSGAWHFNKKHWNGVDVDGTVPDDEMLEWIDHAYELVVSKLTRAQRAALPKA